MANEHGTGNGRKLVGARLPGQLVRRLDEMRWRERHESRNALIEAALEEYLAARERPAEEPAAHEEIPPHLMSHTG